MGGDKLLSSLSFACALHEHVNYYQLTKWKLPKTLFPIQLVVHCLWKVSSMGTCAYHLFLA